MDSQTIELKFESLKLLKKEKQWNEALRLAYAVETDLLKRPDSDQSFLNYLHLVDLLLKQVEIDSGIRYLNLYETNIPPFNNQEHLTHYLQIITKYNLFFIKPEEVTHLIERFIPSAFQKDQYEILSYCFVIQSYLHLLGRNVKLSIQEAKMAYFYAQFITNDNKQDAINNAKLTLVLSLIEQMLNTDLTYTIERFSLNRQKNINGIDHYALEAIEGMLLLLNKEVDEGIQRYKTVLQYYNTTNSIMNCLIIVKQMKSVIQNVQSLLKQHDLQDILNLIAQFEQRYTELSRQISSSSSNAFSI